MARGRELRNAILQEEAVDGRSGLLQIVAAYQEKGGMTRKIGRSSSRQPTQ